MQSVDGEITQQSPNSRSSGLARFLAASLCLASIYQVPQISQGVGVKYAIHLFEIVTFISLYLSVHVDKSVNKWIGISIIFVIIRLLYGWSISYLQYGNDILSSLQEGRFGLMLVAAPLAYKFVSDLNYKQIVEFCNNFLICILIIDIVVYFLYVATGYLSLGERSSNRFVISIMAPAMFVYVAMVISTLEGVKPNRHVLFLIFAMLAHVLLITTSRAEIILVSGLIAFWLYAHLPNLRWLMLLAMLLAVVQAILFVADGQLRYFAGRDFNLAIRYALDTFPYGVGFIPDSVQKAQLGRPDYFFSSDYGVILYVYRYGILGVLFAAILAIIWFRHFVATIRVGGAALFSFSILLYLIVIPVLDYGSFNGGLLLAAMLAVSNGMGRHRAKLNGGYPADMPRHAVSR